MNKIQLLKLDLDYAKRKILPVEISPLQILEMKKKG